MSDKELAQAFAQTALSAIGGEGHCVATEVTEFFTTGTVVPSLRERDCFAQEGSDAFSEGNDRSDCPYYEGTDGQAGWLRGWDLAAQNSL